MELHYQIAMPRPDSHLFEVELSISGPERSAVDLVMPVWTPGSYLVREFARHVQGFSAEGPSGPLPWQKISKHTWRVEAGGASRVTVRYQVYAHELTVRTSHLDRTHGYFNGTSVFMYVDGAQDLPCTLTVRPFAGWRVTTALPPAHPPVERGASRFRARDYDELVDCPVECGRHRVLEFDHRGVPHRIAIWGRPFGGPLGARDEERLRSDFQRIVAEGAGIFGGLPYDDYTFIVHLAPGARGGLEHRSSATLHANPFIFRHPQKYEDFLTLVAHEHFHAWNVKRIRPEALGPFDYTREAYTRALWLVEGVTAYYDTLNVRRAGLMRPERYLERLASEIKQLSEIPGQKLHSLEEASFDAWIKFYRPDESTPNTTVSYYLKGAVVAAILDLELRQRTGGRRSLDDIMRALWQRYRLRHEGFSEGSLEAVFAEVAGGPVNDLFDAYVRGVAELDLDRHLAIAGLKLTAVTPEAECAEKGAGDNGDAAGGPEKPVAGDLGVRTRASGDRIIITHVLEGRPAARAGLYPGDELVALDGFRVTDRGLQELLECLGPGAEVEATVFRRDELVRVPVKLGPPLPTKLRIERVADAPPLAQRIYEQWLETTWEPLEVPAAAREAAPREPRIADERTARPSPARRSPRGPAKTSSRTSAKASGSRRASTPRARPVKSPPKRGSTESTRAAKGGRAARGTPQGGRRERR